MGIRIKDVIMFFVCISVVIIISIPFFIYCYLSKPCRSGHTWQEATCAKPKTCSICGITEGVNLSHNWSIATCSKPAVCSLCGEQNYRAMKAHKYDEKGICSVCGETKQYGNDYGYFSSDELFSMAKEAIKDYVYPSYVSNFCSVSEIHIEKVTDSRLQYGGNSFSIVGYADFVVSGIPFDSRGFVAVIEPHTSSTYAYKDAYVQ